MTDSTTRTHQFPVTSKLKDDGVRYSITAEIKWQVLPAGPEIFSMGRLVSLSHIGDPPPLRMFEVGDSYGPPCSELPAMLSKRYATCTQFRTCCGYLSTRTIRTLGN